MRFLLPAGALVLVPSIAEAAVYVAFDIGLAHRTGAYDWKSPPSPGSSDNNPSPVEFDARIRATGIITHFALGGTIAQDWSIAAEGGLGYLSAKSRGIAYSFVSEMAVARLGVRVEKRLGRIFFVRGAVGGEWIGLGFSQWPVGAHDNVFESEPTRGIYAGVAAGLRGRHVGGFVRADGGMLFSDHATYAPLTLSIGLDVAWF
jgi:hypothetical protein